MVASAPIVHFAFGRRAELGSGITLGGFNGAHRHFLTIVAGIAVNLRTRRASRERSRAARSRRSLETRASPDRAIAASAEVDQYRRALRRLAADLTRTEDELRRRIAAGLHDDLGQLMATLAIHLERMRRWTDDESQLSEIDDANALVKQAVSVMRDLTFDLLIPPLGRAGLPGALAGLADDLERSHGIRCSFESDGTEASLGADASLVLFRVTRELLVNVAKHSSSTQAALTVRASGDAVHVSVTDNGRGFTAPDEGSPELGGVGLIIVRERLAEVGGHIEIHSELGIGTSISVTIPHPDGEASE